ncbi:MAG: glycosyltransferase family 4 protein, partial [Myxococcales bacterium]|nr:glycosyltransferase family 4 protein [Myxococcales bacterium]
MSSNRPLRAIGDADPAARPGLRIGIDATCLGSGRGYGRFVRELLPPLVTLDDRNEYVLFVDEHTAAELGPLPARCVVPPTSQSQADAASARGQRRVVDMWRMGRAVADAQLDVMYFPSVYSFYPVPGRTPVAVAFHDIIPERYGAVVFPTRWNRFLWDAKVLLARRRARGLITVSEWSRRALAEHFGTPPDEIWVTLEAPSPVFRPALEAAPRRAWLRDHGIPEDAAYFVYVGGFNPHKNLTALIDAFADVAAERPSLHLLLVGDFEGDVFHIDVASLRERIAARGVAGRVHLPGFVPDEALRHLYTGALALAIPSLEEGFGLPAVEAAACGTGCIATRNSPLPDVLAGGGLFVDPLDTAALRAALAACADDEGLRRKHGAAALERAGRLSWRATADATRRALEEIARG